LRNLGGKFEKRQPNLGNTGNDASRKNKKQNVPCKPNQERKSKRNRNTLQGVKAFPYATFTQTWKTVREVRGVGHAVKLT